MLSMVALLEASLFQNINPILVKCYEMFLSCEQCAIGQCNDIPVLAQKLGWPKIEEEKEGGSRGV